MQPTFRHDDAPSRRFEECKARSYPALDPCSAIVFSRYILRHGDKLQERGAMVVEWRRRDEECEAQPSQLRSPWRRGHGGRRRAWQPLIESATHSQSAFLNADGRIVQKRLPSASARAIQSAGCAIDCECLRQGQRRGLHVVRAMAEARNATRALTHF
jgi:hypothetical protein